MGISDREYVRTSGRNAGMAAFGWDVIGWIIAVTVVTFVLQLLINPQFTNWFDLRPSAVVYGQVWRLITFDFLHSPDDVWHILVNMYVLYLAGQKLLSNHTQKEFLLFYLASGVVAGICFVLWQLTRNREASAVGASGSVAAVLTLYALYWPRDRWFIFYVIPVPVIALVILSAALDLHPILLELGGGRPRGQIAHIAHLGGMAFAFAYYKLQWRLEPLLGDVPIRSLKRRFRRGPKLRVHRPSFEDERFDGKARMDELLAKISREGEASLTPEERETLNRISRQLRSRKA
ncbi:Rhomboid family protein [Caulifigura coniformis]|uniref:Rhomboid family protein n=2 Tax=Caulifigura coniformis TaxID=2527983 RepID=A0A517SFI5_9PLAN|nr:Rhomboid family protein [Caulifigura coniformis]